MVEIKPYEDARHREQVLSLFSDVAFKSDIWNYQFLENPGASEYGFNPVIAEEYGRVVGFNGVVPVSILWSGQPARAMWSCDFKVAEDYRGQGVGRLIKEELARRSSLFMSFGISPVAAIVLKKMGWHSSNDLHFLRKIKKPRTGRDCALMILQLATQLFNPTVRPAVMVPSISSCLPPGEDIDQLWSSVAKGYGKTVVRDASYLKWRYQQHPFASYQFVSLRDSNGQLQALGVVRAECNQVRWVDYLGPAQGPALKGAMVKAILSGWADAASYSVMTSDREIKQAMKAYGFYQGREQPRFYVWASPEQFSSQDCEHCASDWFVMGGDSDGELLQSARETWNERIKDKEDGECRLKNL